MKWILAVLIAASCLPGATLYNVVGLGGYGGSSASANGIAANGSTAGSGWTAGGVQVAFSGGAGSAPPSTLAAQADASDVNSAGTVFGTSWDTGEARATMWRGGIADRILGMESYGLAINERGDVAGARLTAGRMQAFVRTNAGLLTDLSVSDSLWSAAYDINSGGAAAGYAMLSNGTFRAFAWDGSRGSRLLGTLGGANSYAQAISDTGSIAGSSTTRSGQLHAFVDDGIMRDLGTLGGALSAAYDINSSGQAVGYSYDAAGRSRAFVWSNGMMVDLNSLIDPSSDWTLNAAYGINGSGQIVGEGTWQGQAQAFRLDPYQIAASASASDGEQAIPEPALMPLIGFALLWLGSRRPRRQQAWDGVS